MSEITEIKEYLRKAREELVVVRSKRADMVEELFNQIKELKEVEPEAYKTLSEYYDFENDTAKSVFPALYVEDPTKEDQECLVAEEDKWNSFIDKIDEIQKSKIKEIKEYLGL